MRRILMATGLYLAGLLTVPLMMIGVGLVSARSHNFRIESVSLTSSSEDEVWVDAAPARVSSVPVACETPQKSPVIARLVADEPAFEAELEIFQPSVEVAEQNARGGNLEPESDDPFGTDAPDAGREELGLDEPAAAPATPAVPQVILPVKPEMLATDSAQDEAAVAKVKELREALQKVVAEKAAKLNAEALQAEIDMHTRHLSDLNALQELMRLQQSLKELSDKYPDSDAGRRAGEMLKLLEQQRRATPNRRSRDAFNSSQNPESYKEQPIRPKGA